MSIQIRFPESFIQKTLLREARGERAAEVVLVIPSVIHPSRAVAVNLAVLDDKGMPVAGGTSPVTIFLPDGNGGQANPSIAFAAEQPAVCLIEGVFFPQPGFVRLEAEFNGRKVVSNPALVTTEDRPQILWGDPHIHTVLSDCHPERCRSRLLAYSAARYAYGFDFVAIADHVSGGKRGTIGKWFDNLTMAELFNEPPNFSALLAYETSMPGGKGGDNNVYLAEPRQNYLDPGGEKWDARELAQALDHGDFLVPHHTSRANKHGEISPALYPGQQRMPAVEIHSKWGCSEYRGHPDALNEPHDGPAYVQDLLAYGYRLGFIGGTDTHTSLTFCQALEPEHIRHSPGLTAALCGRNERSAIHDAIRSRNCYAACGERIILDIDCGGLAMGQVKPGCRASEPRRIAVRCAAKSTIETIEIVRNGKCVHSVTPNDWQAECEWSDSESLATVALRDATDQNPFVYYYVRVATASGARAWSSPCWFLLEQ